MSNSICKTCGGSYHWQWEDAFDKFGFDDGDGQVMTDTVADTLREAGYTVSAEPWGFHNVIITSIRHGKRELIPSTATVGYDDPREYLPQATIKLLVHKLGKDTRREP